MAASSKPTPNDLFKHARTRLLSPSGSGKPMSRAELADAVNAWQWKHHEVEDNLTGEQIGAYEQGRNRWPQKKLRREGILAALRAATAEEIGFSKARRPRNSRAPAHPAVQGVPVTGVVRLAGAAWFGMLPPELAELPGMWSSDVAVPDRIGSAHLDALNASITTFEQWDHQYGGGLARAAMAGQLEWVCRAARNSSMSLPIRRRWLSTSARLADLVGWATFDAGAAADQTHWQYLLALQLAGEADDLQQRTHIATSLSRHLTYFGHPEEALDVAGLGRLGWRHLPPLGRAVIGIVEARAHGRAGDTRACIRAVGDCDTHFAAAASGDAADPMWGYYADAGQILGDAGHALFDLAVLTGDDTLATTTITRLQAAYATHPSSAARSRALTMLRVAHLQARRGDISSALESVQAGIADAARVDSRRVRDDLAVLDSVLAHAPADPRDRDQLEQVRRTITATLQGDADDAGDGQ